MSTVSLVTGGNRVIGREVCRQLAGRGHAVVLTARSADAAAAAARAVGAEPLRLDVTEPASVAAAARWVGERYGKLDVLVNNAAITYDTWQRAIDADLAVVREAAETNLYGPWLMVQEFLPLLRGSGHPRIVNVSSEAASLASMGSGTPAYTASKTALNALTRMLAAELRGDRVLVNRRSSRIDPQPRSRPQSPDDPRPLSGRRLRWRACGRPRSRLRRRGGPPRLRP
jgi:NAD(P)-dependent dehydrogenase (short-subunit alcohol dehydrogenase family)